nr:hypothetical protein Q903MT_gene1139 [Picea sitchensis]
MIQVNQLSFVEAHITMHRALSSLYLTAGIHHTLLHLTLTNAST